MRLQRKSYLINKDTCIHLSNSKVTFGKKLVSDKEEDWQLETN